VSLAVDSGDDDDVVMGGGGNDLIVGGAGNDQILGGRGTDVTFMGDGDDTYTWNPGDTSDTVEGQAGTDTLVFNGANVSEQINLSANGERMRLTRDIATVTMDLNEVETVDTNTRGGTDAITIGNLAATDTTTVGIDLAGLSGTGVGDTQTDTVTVEATPGDDNLTITGSAGNAGITGLTTTVSITGADGTDQLYLNTLDGTDTVDTSGWAGMFQLLIDGVLV
jgi:hypothetical protein